VLEDPDRRYYTGLRNQRGLAPQSNLASPSKDRGQLARDLHSALDRLQEIVSAPVGHPR
jgi:hypothetical protein